MFARVQTQTHVSHPDKWPNDGSHICQIQKNEIDGSRDTTNVNEAKQQKVEVKNRHFILTKHKH